MVNDFKSEFHQLLAFTLRKKIMAGFSIILVLIIGLSGLSYFELNLKDKDYAALKQSIVNTERQQLLADAAAAATNAGASDKVRAWLDYEQQQLNTILQDDSSEKNASVAELLFPLLTCLIILLGLIVARAISHYIAEPVVRISRNIEQIADGNLLVSELTLKQNDEIGETARAINRMKQYLLQLIGQINQGAEQVATSSLLLHDGSEKNTVAAKQLTAHIITISGQVQQQHEGMLGARHKAESNFERAEMMKQSADISLNASALVVQEVNYGGSVIEQTVIQMEKIKHSTEETFAIIHQLSARSQEIGAIADVITAIASQTHLLALNASIEAAHAGEQGKGFAIVASEVRKLAEEARVSAEQIFELIANIQKDTNTASHSIGVGIEETEAGMKVVQQAGQSFRNIDTSVQEASLHIGEITAAVSHFGDDSRTMADLSERLATMSQSIAEDIRNISSFSEEQMATVQQMSASSEALTSLSTELREETRKFKITPEEPEAAAIAETFE